MSAKSRKAYIVQPLNDESRWAFIAHPDIPRAWLRVPWCVITSECIHCGAEKGQPCRGYKNLALNYRHTARADSHKRQAPIKNALRREAVVVDLDDLWEESK